MNYNKYGYILVNKILEKAVDELKAIVLSERTRRSGKAPTAEDQELERIAEGSLLSRSHEKVQPVLQSFRTNL